MGKFDKDMKKAEKKIESAIEKAIRGAAIELFSEIITRTPVDTGRLRNNWQASINDPNLNEVSGEDANFASAVSKGASEITTFKIEDTDIWFSNNLPYAEVIEEGGPNRRPYGMVKTSINTFAPALKKLTRDNKV